MIPVSTAVWDPKWYHDFKGNNYLYLDKRGVLNGVRIHPLMPGPSCDNLCHGTEGCESKPDSCAFLQKYYEQLCALSFEEFNQKLQYNCDKLARHYGLGTTAIPVIIVHETPDKLCSERQPIHRWYKENGVDIKEWNKSYLDGTY